MSQLTIKKIPNPSILALSMLASLAITSCLAQAELANTTNVMAPLEVSNWSNFTQQLNTAKSIGVNAVTVDVWWGKVEANGDQQFDWSYYDTLVQHIENAGLHWIPIMSFHQCGGNVGDNCNIPIPSWVWNHYPTVTSNEMKYRSEQLNYSNETVSLWQDDLIIDEYKEFMNAFEDHFSNKANMTDEINISMGPAGELRYPSYNSHDSGTGYPTRGAFQAYSESAKADFRAWAQREYGSLADINTAWGFSLSSFNDINPPSNASQFINDNDHYDMQYGRDFISWYHESLVDHGEAMMDAAISAFDSAFSDTELGYKIPGVHWQMSTQSSNQRSAEMAAGLIPSNVDLNSTTTGHGYSNIVGLAASYAGTRDVTLHFTALEMDNQNWYPQYSLAKDLVFWVAQNAQDQNVIIKGENALSGGVNSHLGWDNIENVFLYSHYSGMTVLRINDVTTGGVGQSRYASFIQDYHDKWYFSGSPNNWTSWDLVQTGSTQWQITHFFNANGAFKIRHSDNNWNESYPQANWNIWQGAGTYQITFDSSDHIINVIKQ